MHPDFLIIGAGLIGYTTARELVKSGASVTILERGQAGREASWAGGGILSPLLSWHYSDAVTRLAEWSRRLYPSLTEELLAQTGIDPEYRVSGMLVLPPFDAEQAQGWCAAYKVRLVEMNSRDIAPRLARSESALWLPEIAQVRPPRLLRALRRWLETNGVIIEEQTAATRLNVAGARVISASTNRGEYRTGQVIICAGAWSQHVLGSHGLDLQIGPVRGQMLLFRVAPGTLQLIVLCDDFYLIPREDGQVIAGSSVEEVGFDKSTTPELKRLLLEKAHGLLPELTASTLTAHWAGLRPGSPGNIPTIARHPRLSNLYINSGHYRYGMTMAPGSARMLANLVFEREQPMSDAAYRWPQRAHEGVT